MMCSRSVLGWIAGLSAVLLVLVTPGASALADTDSVVSGSPLPGPGTPVDGDVPDASPGSEQGDGEEHRAGGPRQGRDDQDARESGQERGEHDSGGSSSKRDDFGSSGPSAPEGEPDLCWSEPLGPVRRCTVEVETDDASGGDPDSMGTVDVDSGGGREDRTGAYARSSADVSGGLYENDAVVWGAAAVGFFALLGVFLYRVFAVLWLGRGFLPLTWRLDRERVMDHPVRQEIMAHLVKHPGATVQELADVAKVRNSSAAYHVSILKREERVSERVVDGRRHFFLYASPVVDPMRLRKRAWARPGRSPGKVLGFLSASPGATVSNVARSLGFSPGQAHYHLCRLEERGLLERLRRGRRVRHYLTGEGRELVTRLQEQGDSVPPPSAPARSGGEVSA